jgi:hydroxyacylglutathione hydrolase
MESCCPRSPYHRVVIPSDASSADIDFATGAPIDGADEPMWIHGAPSRKQCADPAIQVRSFYGFTDWPVQTVSFDLGGRVLELTGTPGHNPASVTVYDPWTGFLVTGDTILPGRLYAKDYGEFLQGLERLVEFTAQRKITRVLGCHIEMSRTPGHDYPAGNTYQPDEVPLRLPAERIADIRDAARAAPKPGVYVHEDFIIWNGGQRLVPMLGQAFRLIAYNRANRKQARRG